MPQPAQSNTDFDYAFDRLLDVFLPVKLNTTPSNLAVGDGSIVFPLKTS
jgi:hypothetical protein